MTRYYAIILVCMVLPLIQSCVNTSPVDPKQTVKRDDPMIGRIIDARTGQPVAFNALIDTISEFDVIYLSEKHDNPGQHAAQQKIIQAVTDKLAPLDKKPSIGFEFFAMDNTPDLLNFMDAGKIEHSTKTENDIEKDLRMKLGWKSQSDTLWKYYYDLLTLARKKNLLVAGIDLSSTLKKRITRYGINGITDLEKENLFSTRLNNRVYKDYMSSIFKAVHCGMGNDRMASRLYDTWVARNDKMALSISQMHTHGSGPVIVIVGGGHTEYSLGIIDRVAAINKNIRQINIGMTEISVEPAGLDEYLSPLELEGYPNVPRADYLWFFQRVSYDDPCDKFKEAFKKMKTRNKK